MIFHELYGVYYRTVARILTEAIASPTPLSDTRMREIIADNAFSESALTIVPALRHGAWQLLRPDGTTPLRHAPTRPLTLLEKRWLRAILLDPRMRLFGVDTGRFADVEPLFRPEDIVVFDRYADGDNYDDAGYIRRFRIIFHALTHHVPVQITQLSRTGREIRLLLYPEKLEYSEKDDKFRLIGVGRHGRSTVNLGRILACRLCHDVRIRRAPMREDATETFTLRIRDERNALERVMLHFAEYKKQAIACDDGSYRLTVYYRAADETELVIRVLSFGPLVEVVEPTRFRALIRQRLQLQARWQEQ